MTLARIRDRSPILKEMESNGQIKIVGALSIVRLPPLGSESLPTDVHNHLDMTNSFAKLSGRVANSFVT